jgi:hypothetical protein
MVAVLDPLLMMRPRNVLLIKIRWRKVTKRKIKEDVQSREFRREKEVQDYLFQKL